ncbi:hypothetical protein [Promicromonospora iranensis]|uniref:Beta-lactamase regulating signal transducer with metallopeptidase domain n=1 Tax=Promicromonospora iranensis TaxID=1105144 RepID=A0ABU2CLW3_9MICO|nr:hypothetical protein [Promicromonospora iranensis]MDR7382339.1 beta-lactamase regulating signal transducer with metallopeptidase domain [Promicromonospora iranensis]
MTTSHDVSGADNLSQPPPTPDDAPVPDRAPVLEQVDASDQAEPEKNSGHQASAGVTAALALVLWLAIVLVVLAVQIFLNRSFGRDLEVGSLPRVWDWVLTIAALAGTWVLVRRRHPRVGPSAESEEASGRKPSAGVTTALVLALWVAIVLVLAITQIFLNRSLDLDIELGSLPGVWNWLLTFSLLAGTWALVRSRHPRIGP